MARQRFEDTANSLFGACSGYVLGVRHCHCRYLLRYLHRSPSEVTTLLVADLLRVQEQGPVRACEEQVRWARIRLAWTLGRGEL